MFIKVAVKVRDSFLQNVLHVSGICGETHLYLQIVYRLIDEQLMGWTSL